MLVAVVTVVVAAVTLVPMAVTLLAAVVVSTAATPATVVASDSRHDLAVLKPQGAVGQGVQIAPEPDAALRPPRSDRGSRREHLVYG